MRAKIWLWADRLIDLSALIGTLGLVVQVVVILIDVIGRYFGAPLTGAQDITQMAMVIVVFGGMALCDRLNGHIAVDVLEPFLPAAINRLANVISPALGAVIFIVIAYTVWQSAQLSIMLHLATNIIYLPKAWFQYAIVVMALITAFAMILKAIAAAQGQPPPEHPSQVSI